jgi:hypothetical protein
MTLVELLVAMAVTSILLVGMTGAFFTVTSKYQDWAHRLQTASVGAGLAASLQADSHRYVRCDSTALAPQHVSTLQLCPADATTAAAVTYQVSASTPNVISRQPSSQAAAFMLRSTGTATPYFTIDCFDNGSTLSGHIHVYNLRLPSDSLIADSGETFSVYYVAPRGTRGC